MQKFRPQLAASTRPKNPNGIPNIRPSLPPGSAPRPSPLPNLTRPSIMPTTAISNLEPQISAAGQFASANVLLPLNPSSSIIQDHNIDQSTFGNSTQSKDVPLKKTVPVSAYPPSILNEPDPTNSDVPPTNDTLISNRRDDLHNWLSNSPVSTCIQLTSAHSSPQVAASGSPSSSFSLPSFPVCFSTYFKYIIGTCC